MYISILYWHIIDINKIYSIVICFHIIKLYYYGQCMYNVQKIFEFREKKRYIFLIKKNNVDTLYRFSGSSVNLLKSIYKKRKYNFYF